MGKGMMRLAAAACALALPAIALAGCISVDSDERVLEKLDALEAEIDALKSGQTNGDAAPLKGEDNRADVIPSQGGDETLGDLGESYPELSDFERRVSELEAACASIEPKDTLDENYRAFLDMKYELDALEHEMDAYDDEREFAAKSGDVPYGEYMEIERAIDRLDDRLDYAKDGLELRLGIDD